MARTGTFPGTIFSQLTQTSYGYLSYFLISDTALTVCQNIANGAMISCVLDVSDGILNACRQGHLFMTSLPTGSPFQTAGQAFRMPLFTKKSFSSRMVRAVRMPFSRGIWCSADIVQTHFGSLPFIRHALHQTKNRVKRRFWYATVK